MSFQGARAPFPKVLILLLAPSKKFLPLPTVSVPIQKKKSGQSPVGVSLQEMFVCSKTFGKDVMAGRPCIFPLRVFFSEQKFSRSWSRKTPVNSHRSQHPTASKDAPFYRGVVDMAGRAKPPRAKFVFRLARKKMGF